MSEDPSTSGRFTPSIYTKKKNSGPRFQDPLLSLTLDYLKLGAFQLVTVGGAAALAKTAVAPLERVKILMQVQGMQQHSFASRSAPLPYSGLWQTLRTTVSQHGLRSMYWGHGANVLRVMPEVMLKFGINDQLRVIFSSSSEHPSLGSRLAAGCTTGVLRTLLFHPLSVIRTRLTADYGATHPPRLYAGIAHCVRDTWRRESIRGFYGGFGLAAATSAPYLTVCFAAYDEMQALLPQDKHSQQLWWFPLAKIGVGAGAGVAAQVATYPLDTLRRRMELNGALGYEVTYRSTAECVRQVVTKEGWRALYRGCGVNCLKMAPSAAIQFVAYDSFKSLMMAIDPAQAALSKL